MKALVSKNHKVAWEEQSLPELSKGYVRIQTAYSVISPGTELGMIELYPNQEVRLGYSASGIVTEVGDAAQQVKVGDRVACYGAPYVYHGEVLTVPKTLVAKVPDDVSLEHAAFGGLGAIAIHALRKAELQFGETVAIAGLGVIGQIITSLADASAYETIAFDVNPDRCEMAASATVQVASTQVQFEEKILEVTHHQGADAVLLCMGGKRNPITQDALKWVRKQGKVVIVGDVEPDFPRNLLFSKEASIHISRAGGPGRYDALYEKQATDFPYEYIRWTEGRNLAAFLSLVAKNKLDVNRWKTKKVSTQEATDVYQRLRQKNIHDLSIIFDYDQEGK